MPIYEYRCTECRTGFEQYQAVGDPAPACPRCGGASKKVYASVGLIFKGSGFHTTDYRKGASGNGEKPSPSTPTETPTGSGTTSSGTTSST